MRPLQRFDCPLSCRTTDEFSSSSERGSALCRDAASGREWGSLWKGLRAVERNEARARASACARYSTSVIVPVRGAPTAPRGRITRSRRIVRWSGWVVAVVAVRVVIRAIVVGVCKHGAQGESSEPDPNGSTRADPTSTPTPTCICGPRHCRQPDRSKDRCGDGQPPASLPKELGKLS